MSENVYKIRPAGRHLLTIGRDLIQDSYAAIVELVKTLMMRIQNLWKYILKRLKNHQKI